MVMLSQHALLCTSCQTESKRMPKGPTKGVLLNFLSKHMKQWKTYSGGMICQSTAMHCGVSLLLAIFLNFAIPKAHFFAQISALYLKKFFKIAAL